VADILTIPIPSYDNFTVNGISFPIVETLQNEGMPSMRITSVGTLAFKIVILSLPTVDESLLTALSIIIFASYIFCWFFNAYFGSFSTMVLSLFEPVFDMTLIAIPAVWVISSKFVLI
jgi:hypothetical protein